MRPRIAITLGDVAGIGPEVVVRAWRESPLATYCRPVVVGHPAVVGRAAAQWGGGLCVRSIDSIDAIEGVGDDAGAIPCWNPGGDDAADVAPGRNDARAGHAAYECLVAAANAARSGKIDAITTAPLSKAALHLAGHDYPGHTEILADLCGVSEFAMMLYLTRIDRGNGRSHNLGVAHATLHTSIKSVPHLLTTPLIVDKVRLVGAFLKRVGCAAPRIAICALNPHAGEEGLFGDEEARIIAPAVALAAHEGLAAIGPIPADALFKRAVGGEFDGVVAMYHDQGHIALKLVGFDRAVNVTLGLPLIRTSPSHGTAFDIAWKGIARPEGMIEAIGVAAMLAKNKAFSS